MSQLFKSKGFWIGVGILLLVLFVGYMYKRNQKSQMDNAQAETEQAMYSAVAQSGTTPLSQGSMSMTNAPVSVMQAGGVTPYTGTVLTGTQCRQTLRGKCGRRCAFPKGKCAARKECWERSKVNICGFKPTDKMEID